MDKAIEKIRKGLVDLIEGLIEDSEETIKEGTNHPIVKPVLESRIKKIDEYLSEAITYAIPKEKIGELRRKYWGLKATIENLK